MHSHCHHSHCHKVLAHSGSSDCWASLCIIVSSLPYNIKYLEVTINIFYVCEFIFCQMPSEAVVLLWHINIWHVCQSIHNCTLLLALDQWWHIKSCHVCQLMRNYISHPKAQNVFRVCGGKKIRKNNNIHFTQCCYISSRYIKPQKLRLVSWIDFYRTNRVHNNRRLQFKLWLLRRLLWISRNHGAPGFQARCEWSNFQSQSV